MFLLIPLKTSFSDDVWPRITAHRGRADEFYENTIFSFKKLIEAGSDLIELDVQLTKDGNVVVYHPNRLEKLTNGHGEIKNFTLAEIKKLKLKKSKDEVVPTLNEALESVRRNHIFIIDLKSVPKSHISRCSCCINQ